MASKISLTPETLLAQGTEMENLTSEFESLFSQITNTLNDTNSNWSENLARNFSGKIGSAQQSFRAITEFLKSGSQAARNSAQTFSSIDVSLSNAMSANEVVSSAVSAIRSPAEAVISGDVIEDTWGAYQKLPKWVRNFGEDWIPGTKEYTKIAKVIDHIKKGKFNWKKDGSNIADVTGKVVFDRKGFGKIFDAAYNGKGTQIIKAADDAFGRQGYRYIEKGEYGKAAGCIAKNLLVDAYGEFYNIFDAGTEMVGQAAAKPWKKIGSLIEAAGYISNASNTETWIGNATIATGSAIRWYGKIVEKAWSSMF